MQQRLALLNQMRISIIVETIKPNDKIFWVPSLTTTWQLLLTLLTQAVILMFIPAKLTPIPGILTPL